MKILRRPMAYLLTIIVTFLALMIVAYAWYKIEILQPYEKFSALEHEAVPKFDALNEEVAQSLPPLPDNSVLQDKWSVGISSPLYEHGRWLVLKISTTSTADFILEYYDSSLAEKGWSQNTIHHAFEDVFYYKGTSCIRISPPQNSDRDYQIEIWHDFKNQVFSPQMPNPKILSWFETGMANFAVCP